eukprot:1284754-Rhodomonas_salina.1
MQTRSSRASATFSDPGRGGSSTLSQHRNVSTHDATRHNCLLQHASQLCQDLHGNTSPRASRAPLPPRSDRTDPARPHTLKLECFKREKASHGGAGHARSAPGLDAPEGEQHVPDASQPAVLERRGRALGRQLHPRHALHIEAVHCAANCPEPPTSRSRHNTPHMLDHHFLTSRIAEAMPEAAALHCAVTGDGCWSAADQHTNAAATLC